MKKYIKEVFIILFYVWFNDFFIDFVNVNIIVKGNFRF